MRKRVFSRQTLAVLLALSMCLSLLPVSAFAEEPEEAGERTCICSVPCGLENPNEECPVCAGDAAACAAAPVPVETVPADAEQAGEEDPGQAPPADAEEPSGEEEDPGQAPPADVEEPSGEEEDPDQEPPADTEEPSGEEEDPGQTPPADAEEPSGEEEDPDQEPPADTEEPSGEEESPDQEPPADTEEPSEGDKGKAPSNSNTEMNVPPANVQPKAGDTWEKVEWNAIKDGGTYVITVRKGSEDYLLPSAASSKNPPADPITIAGDTLETDAATYGWTFTAAEGGGFQIQNGGNYLYPATGKTNGVRVGTEYSPVWTLAAEGLLSAHNGTAQRYMGVYKATPDWRTYTSPTGPNIKDDLVSFWHLKDETIVPETKVKTPTATPGTGSTVAQGATVTLSCTTKDVTYYTSTDSGNTWLNVTGNTFTIPADASDDYSVQVKATKANLDDSDVLELTYHIFDSTSVKDIAVARQGEAGTSSNPGDTFAVSGVVTYKSGSNYYIQDDTAGIVLYDNSLNLTRGQKVTVSGGLAKFNDLLELVKVTVFSTEPGTLPTPKAVTIAEINDDVQAQLIKITGAKVKAVSGKTVTLSGGEGDAEKTINITNYASSLTNLSAGDTVDVTAVVSRNSSGNYLLVNSDSDITIRNDVEDTPAPPVELYKPEIGDKVVLFYPGGGQVMTGTASGDRLAGAAASSGGGSLFVESDSYLVLTVGVTTGADGAEEYTFTAPDGRLLNTKDDGNSLTLAAAESAVYTKWALSMNTAQDGWLVRSTQAEYNGNKNQYIEFYGGNFTTYSLKDGDPIFTMLFVKAENVKNIDWTVDSDIEQVIAQWGGGSRYADNALSIPGDLLAIGDMLDSGSAFTAVSNGSPVKPFTTGTGAGGGAGNTSYYMGGSSIGAGSDDYLQFKTSSKGWGGMKLSFRLRTTAAAAGEWTLQYSTDGVSFGSFDKGSYSASYTQYGAGGVGTPVTKEGTITDGIAKTSIVPGGTYISFAFDVPVGAENAEELYIRLVPGNTRADGKGGEISGTVRADTVKLSGSPVVSSGVTQYVVIEPDNLEEVGTGTQISLTCATSGATVYYGWADNATGYVSYTAGNTATVPDTLPATLFTYASSTGKANSAVRTMTYRPAAVASVQMNPNGGSVYLGNGSVDVELTTATEGAAIFYSLGEMDDSGNLVYQPYVPGTTKITLTDGFGTLTVSAYAEKEGYAASAVTTRTFTQRLSEKFQLYFGQMHSHTSYSDGAGTAAEAFRSVRDLDQDTWNMDFLSVTDHSNSFDCVSSVGRLADTPTGTEWNEGKKLARDITDTNFVGIFGYEMTWSNGLGHINTFNTPGYQARTQSDYSAYSTALQNYYAELKTVPTSISQFNHPGTTFGDFSDFAHYDEEIDQLITLIEVGNGEGAIGSSGYFPSYEYYTRALDKGWHVAPSNNQDNHKGGWGTANTGRDVVLVDELSEDAIYDAMRNYRVYATEDLNLEIYYTFDGNIMGAILGADSYVSGDSAEISVALNDPNDEGATVEVIVNGGKSLQSKSVSGNGTVTFTVENPGDYSYYYIRVTQDDGDIAVTAPVWVGTVEAVGITSLTAEKAITVAGQEQSFTLELYNNETSPLEVRSIDFTVKETGELLHSAKDVTRVPRLGTATTSFTTSFDTDGSVTVVATVRGTLRGVEKTYTQELELKVMPGNVVSRVIVDGSHYNDYVTGYYGGRMGNMTTIAAGLGVEVIIAREITADLLENCQLLVISAPARRAGTDNAGPYEHSMFEDSFIQMVKDYVAGGGNIAVCGLADYQDKQANGAENHAAAQLNKLLAAIGSSLRINDDQAMDDTHNGGQAYRLYPETFNMASKWCRGIIAPETVAEGETYQTYSQYSGCTVDPGSGTWLVKGFDTTYAADSDNDGLPTAEPGNVCFLACEEIGSGTVFAAGGVFLSDFEVAAELDNIWDLPYANRTIYENILGMVRSGIEITPIAETRKAPLNKVFAIEGYVTSGTTNPGTTFFDSIYVQDASGGTDVFPYATAGLAIGTKVRVLGYTDAYQGDRELQVINLEILDAEPYIYEPTELTTAQATDYETYGGLLVKTSGTVSDIVLAGGRVSQFKLTDSSGKAATVFIDGYITNPEGVNNIHTWLKDGQTVSAIGLLYSHPEGDSDVSVPVLRVRNCDEIEKLSDQPETPEKPDKPGGSSGGGSDGTSKPSVRPSNPPAEETPSASSGSFRDVPDGFWAEDAISWAAQKGIMQGYGSNEFNPDRQVTRQQLWMVLGRLNGANPADMSAAAVWAVSSGVSDGTKGANTMSRQQMVTMLYRYAQLKGYPITGSVGLESYADADKVAAYAQEALAWAVGNGIMQGTSQGLLNPEGTASRAHFAVFMQRFCTLFGIA